MRCQETKSAKSTFSVPLDGGSEIGAIDGRIGPLFRDFHGNVSRKSVIFVKTSAETRGTLAKVSKSDEIQARECGLWHENVIKSLKNVVFWSPGTLGCLANGPNNLIKSAKTTFFTVFYHKNGGVPTTGVWPGMPCISVRSAHS